LKFLTQDEANVELPLRVEVVGSQDFEATPGLADLSATSSTAD
jgi:hypothetical protein